MRFEMLALLLLGGGPIWAGDKNDIVPPDAKVEKVAGQCRFTEGPAGDAEGNLFFTDSPRNRIMVLRANGALDVWNADSRDANGMRFDAQGRLVACCGEDGARAVVRWEKDGKRTILADRYQGKRLTAPNDLCFDRQGRIYFTDPCYGRKPADGQERFAVYRIDAADGAPIANQLTRVIDDCDTPNGICISPDNKTLYVADNASRKNGPHTLIAYDILSDGTCKRRAVLHDFKEARGIDGMAVDTKGNIYATAESGPKTGVYIFSPEGKQLGFIRTPETATNCAFGDKDLKTLFITAGSSVYKVRVNAVGSLPYPQPAAKVQSGLRWVDFTAFKDIKSALVSPDGGTIACILATTDLPANQIRSELWLFPTAAGEGKRLALDTDAFDKILWSPKGDKLALVGTFRDKQSSATFLMLVDPITGQSKRLTRIERGNHYLAHQGANLCWSPDGTHLAYLAADAEAPPRGDGPLVVSRIQYKTRTAFSDNRSTHIWTIETATGKTRQITTGQFDEHSIDWAPKGDEIIFCSNRAADPDANLNYDLYSVRLADGVVRLLTKTAGSEMTPVCSPDGRHIAFTMTKRSATTIDSVAEDDHVWVLNRETGTAREMTAKLDRRCAHVRWEADSKHLAFLVRDHGTSLIYRMPATGGDATPVFRVKGMVSSFSLAQGSGRSVCVVSTPTEPAEIWTFHADDAKPRTRLNDEAAAAWKWVEPKEVNFKSFDGTPVQGWLMLPADATPQAKAPLILAVHGGPHGMFGLQFSSTFQLLCARGYAVLLLNPRGSNGYGQRFSDGCVNDWGGGDFKDLMAGLDHALAQYPQLDAKRLGVMGGSYGGYMTNWIITQTDRFKAAVPYSGLSNLISFYATSLYQDLVHIEFNGKPWDNFDLLWDRSPLKHIKRVSTPTLLLHGEADNDVHITQAEEMFTALKQRGIETVFVRYPREGHGATEPRYQLDQSERTLAWFDRFLR